MKTAKAKEVVSKRQASRVRQDKTKPARHTNATPIQGGRPTWMLVPIVGSID
jgi:hypothetical protein